LTRTKDAPKHAASRNHSNATTTLARALFE
jgi:hypothetical protein